MLLVLATHLWKQKKESKKCVCLFVRGVVQVVDFSQLENESIPCTVYFEYFNNNGFLKKKNL